MKIFNKSEKNNLKYINIIEEINKKLKENGIFSEDLEKLIDNYRRNYKKKDLEKELRNTIIDLKNFLEIRAKIFSKLKKLLINIEKIDKDLEKIEDISKTEYYGRKVIDYDKVYNNINKITQDIYKKIEDVLREMDNIKNSINQINDYGILDRDPYLKDIVLIIIRDKEPILEKVHQILNNIRNEIINSDKKGLQINELVQINRASEQIINVLGIENFEKVMNSILNAEKRYLDILNWLLQELKDIKL
ncbi:hypothetical protein MJ1_0600 [Nanobdella aerobiophila]|uniref:Uncharacterized protein n=1 Tax=Nanobdella aerobiophila TaxID=2586965 RepID=A0A915SFZ2_9ARCH|nr:hypothetical protein [Nanobdella aerobiophila]BBL45749.1 hypothetical protein MJ1_0600 [Nanobdella aerobiophila]